MSARIEYDLLLVGASPSNLTLAYHFLELAAGSSKKFTIGILEKGKEFGSHVMSGAVCNPHILEKVWPKYKESGFPIEATCTQSNLSVLGVKEKWDIPPALAPRSLNKTGYLVLTLSQCTYWMASQVKEKAKEVPNVAVDIFLGFSAHEIVYENDRVAGVATVEDPQSEQDYVWAKFISFGDKGFISRDIIDKYELRDCPQLWAVGVKEVWQVTQNYEGSVWHTLGWPLLEGTFGGAFVYGMKDNKLTIGLVISLDSKDPNMNPQLKLQELKKHPWMQEMLSGGKLLKYGAALLPEGGYYSLPKKFAVPGALFLGDALGVLSVKHLAGIDRSMECGYIAAEILHDALSRGNLSGSALEPYQERLWESFVIKDLYQDRYLRWAFVENAKLLGNYLPAVAAGVDRRHPIWSGIKLALSNPLRVGCDGFRALGLMTGILNIGPVRYQAEYKNIVPAFVPHTYATPPFDKALLYSRADAVFYAGVKYHEENHHISEFNAQACVECITTYDKLGKDTPCVADCTAEVHRIDIVSGVRKHGMSLENCVHCRTCEIVCPQVNLRVNPTEEGSGPDFMGL